MSLSLSQHQHISSIRVRRIIRRTKVKMLSELTKDSGDFERSTIKASARQRELDPGRRQDLSSVLPEQYEPTSTCLHINTSPPFCPGTFTYLPSLSTVRRPTRRCVYQISTEFDRSVPHKPPRPLHSQLPSTSPRPLTQLPFTLVAVLPPNIAAPTAAAIQSACLRHSGSDNKVPYAQEVASEKCPRARDDTIYHGFWYATRPGKGRRERNVSYSQFLQHYNLWRPRHVPVTSPW
jgi:hypothetical protein